MKSTRWKCVVAYDGTDFSGWQSQPGGNAIQDIIEGRLGELLGGRVRIHGSGRTDAGVHAHGQVFHFDGCWSHGSESLLAALRVGLPATIQVKSARQVSGEFHARFSAKEKVYFYEMTDGGFADPFRYRFCWSIARPLDVMAMQKAAECLRGRHDFRAFSAFGGKEREDTVRNLSELSVIRRGRQLRLIARGDGFLYKMVRSLTGALVYVGKGKLSVEELKAILESRKRTHLVETAPPQGLFLHKVFY